VIHIHETARIYGETHIGENSIIMEHVIVGFPSADILKDISENIKEKWEEKNYKGAKIGKNALIRANTVIYCDVVIGDDFKTGHNVIIRERTKIGDDVLVGTNTVIEGYSTIGNHVRIQSNVFIPVNTTVEDFVFIGPNAVLTNDKYPLRVRGELRGPVIRKSATIGANAVILPDVEVGEGAFVAAGAVVTRDVPSWKMAVGTPARIVEMPEMLNVPNDVR